MSDELLQQRYKLKHNKYKKEFEIKDINREIKEINREIKEINKKIFKTCDHKWIYNKWCNWDDLCKYYCFS